MIYNPWFEAQGIEAVVVPVGVEPRSIPALLKALFGATNVHGASSPCRTRSPRRTWSMKSRRRRGSPAPATRSCVGRTARCWANVRRRGLRPWRGAQGTADRRARGRWWSAAAVSAPPSRRRWLPPARRRWACTIRPGAAAEALADRLRQHYPAIQVTTGSNDPHGYDIVVNATPLGMKAGDPLPVDTDRIAPTTFVGEVVMKEEFTPLLRAAKARDAPCRSAPTCCSR